MAHFHQFAGVVVEDCIEHYDGEFLLGKSCWLQWCLGDLNVGSNACQDHLLLDCSYFISTIRPHYCCVFWAGLLWGLVVPLSGWRFPILAALIFLWSSAILLNCCRLSNCCGDDLSKVSIPILSSTLGSMAYSHAALGTAAGLWLLLSASLGDCRSIGTCCVGAVILRSLLSSILGLRISCSLRSLSTVSLHSCGGTPVVRVFASPPMAATIWSSGVTDGLVRYLCLNHTTPDTCMVWVVSLVVLEQCADEVSLVAMLCVSLLLVWLEVH
jgi:hypothetical protein